MTTLLIIASAGPVAFVACTLLADAWRSLWGAA